MRKVAFVAAVLGILTLPAYALEFDFGGGTNPLLDTAFQSNANTSTLIVGGPIPAGNQPQNIQCIICGTHQPQQDLTFGYNNYKQGGNISTFATSSTSALGGVQLDNNTLGDGYGKAFLLSFLAGINAVNVNVGIDVNTAQGAGPEILERFVVVDLANKLILADTGQIHMSLPTLNNGNGFPDYTISGFDLNRNDILPGAQLAFLARWSNTSDGAESFFLVPQAVPGPVVGAGLPGLIAACGALLALARSRRRRVV
jgi:hypothetical protein